MPPRRETARAAGETRLNPVLLDDLLDRWRAGVEAGYLANPPPEQRSKQPVRATRRTGVAGRGFSVSLSWSLREHVRDAEVGEAEEHDAASSRSHRRRSLDGTSTFRLGMALCAASLGATAIGTDRPNPLPAGDGTFGHLSNAAQEL